MLLRLRLPQRRWRLVLALALATALLLLVIMIWHDASREHVLRHDLFELQSLSSVPDLSSRKAVCSAHGLAPTRSSNKKIYDLILLSTELDWLEIRLHTLSPYVSYFVILESATTFSGKPKATLLDDSFIWNRFSQFHHQIIHRIVEDPIKSTRSWDHEDFQRNALLTSVFPTLRGTEVEPRKGDVLLISDVDELIRPATAMLLRACDIPRRLTLASQFFYYSFQWKHVGPQWPHPQATTYQGSIESTLRPNDLRMNIFPPSSLPLVSLHSLRRWWDRATLWDAGWHCSSCFATVAEFRTKMESFSHTSLNTEENRNTSVILDRVRNGTDLFGRESEKYELVEQRELDLPEYIWKSWTEQGKFGWLVDRTGSDAGFIDLD